MTKKEAVYEFMQKDFDAIDTEIIRTLMNCDTDDVWTEVTKSKKQFDDVLPMWGTMWSFSDNIDDWWLEERGGLRKMSKIGFRIYKSEKYGYFFGIDGCGYSFYEAHWEPLYDARGIHWHDEP